jgi:hypothetical protein
MMKPHPGYEKVKWVVLEGENMTVVIFEEIAGKTKVRTDVTNSFREDIPHKHEENEQISFFLGYGEGTPKEMRVKGYETLRNTANETGIVGEGVIQWMPPGIIHGIPIPQTMLEKFQKNGPFPGGCPEGTVLYWVDIYAPPRPDFYEYWNSL